MVVKKSAKLRNTMALPKEEKCFVKIDRASKAMGREDGYETVQGGAGRTVETLQSAFLKFKRNRQNKLQQLAVKEKALKQGVRSADELDKLREKFVTQAKSYLGVPYSRKYHTPGSPEYDAPLFLDCCGLVRKVMRDLEEDFGFSVGPWNQAYMYDTLPKNVKDVKDLKPGDLVFVSGTFFDPKRRKHRHNMVHVEIWAGDGEKTIGARWQKGKVQIHDSYQYVSKSYYNMVYHFKSIDTWLNGVCKSFCARHRWKSSTYVHGKRSIFSLSEPDQPAEDFSSEEKCTDYEGNVVDTKDSESIQERSVEKAFGGEENTVCVGEDRHDEKGIICKEEEVFHYQGKVFYEANKLHKLQGIDVAGNVPIEENKECRNENAIQLSVDIVNEEKISVEMLDEIQGCGNSGNSFEYACFCNLCMTDSHAFEKIKESEHFDILHSSQITGADCSDIHLHSSGEDCLKSVVTTNEGANCMNPGVLHTPNDDVLVNNVAGELVSQVSSRPNNGGAGAGAPRKQGLAIVSGSVNRRGKGGTRRRGDDEDESNNPRGPSRPLCRPNPSLTRLQQKPPTFFIGGHNGAKMVEATLSSLGWERIHDHHDLTFYLKWVECKRNLDFRSFREGEQLVNHIPNGNLLTTKIGLLTSLQEFDRVSSKLQASSTSRRLCQSQMNDFVPETYKLQNQTEIDNFINDVYQDGEMWICKPTGMNQGKGIFLIRSREELLEKLEAKSQGRKRCFPSPGRVIQRYILNPFLLNGYKADIRTYMLIAGTCPYMVFYHPGYVRLSLVPYSRNQEEVHAHLTNQYIQKKHPLYEQVKEETVWSLEQLQEYVNKTSNNTLPSDWVFTAFTKRMQQIMLHCFQSVRYKLERKLGYFDLLGFDFMLDENLKVWLIEINVNPALHTNCKILSGVIPELVDTTLKLVLEVFEKSKRREKILPLENLGKFQLLFSDDKK